jgi:subtilisin-like proprotein convertase family protein
MGMQAIGRWLGEPKKVALLLLAAGLAAVAALGLAASAASAATFSNNEGITINDGSQFCSNFGAATAVGTADPYPSVIAVSGLGSSVTDVNVTVSGLTHSYPDDIGLLLVSPAGQSAILMTDSGGDFDHPASGIDLTFDDAASGPAPDNTKLKSRTYLPSRGTTTATPPADCTAPASFPKDATGTNPPAGPYGTSLSVFNGTDPNGDWKLYVIDDSAVHTGSITSWSLDITTTPVPTTKEQCKNGGWREFDYPNQGACISDVNRRNH